MSEQVEEVEIDFKTAELTSYEIYQDQLKAGKAAPPEDHEISQDNLRVDLHAKMEKARAASGKPPEVITKAAQAPQGTDQAPEPQPKAEEPPKPEKTPQQILEELGLKQDPKKRIITDAQGNTREYIQKPLSFMGKMQFLSYIGEVLDKAMSGSNALQIGSLFEVPGVGRGDLLSAQDFSDAQTFVQAVGKLLVHAPDFLTKSYCIWLRVPEYDRDWVAEAMEETLTDEEGFDIIDTFIDQNWGTLQGFFSEKLPLLRDRLQARYHASQSEQSKR